MAAVDPSTVHGHTNECSPQAPPPILSLDDNGLTEGAAHPALMDIDNGGAVISGGGTFLPQTSPHLDPAQDANDLPNPPIVVDSHKQAWQQLINRTISQDELPSLIETVFSNRKAINTVDPLRESDAQALIDVIDMALSSLSLTPNVRRNCVKSLYRTCDRHSLLPGSLQIEVQYNPAIVPHSRGGFSDVWKGKCDDQEVAVKVLRTDSKKDIQKIVREFVTWKALNHPNVLPLLGVMVTEDRFAMVSEWMTNGNINQFVAAHRDANRFELLSDVARGLIYMHSHGMIHGDLKGLNILVDHTCRARLADFGLLAITSDSTTLVSSAHGGTTRWMSPELLDPEVEDHRRTVYSDCYALGMVIYEVLSERTPFYQFYQCSNMAISWKILKGARPGRPEGAEGGWFTDDVWEVLGRCWASRPRDRPSVEDILQYLEKVSRSWTPALVPPMAAGSLTQEYSDITILEGSNVRATLPPSEVVLHQPPVKLGLEEVAGIVDGTPPNNLMEHPHLRASNPPPVQGLLGETPIPEDYPLFKSRRPTRTKWINNPNPKYDSFPIRDCTRVNCFILSHGRIILAPIYYSIHVYSPNTCQLTMSLEGHTSSVLALSATKDTLVSVSDDRTARIWDLNTGRCVHVFRGHTRAVSCLAIVKPEWIEVTGGDGVIRREKWPKQPMVVTGSLDHTLYVWLLPRPSEAEHRNDGSDPVDAWEDLNKNPYHKFHLRGHVDGISCIAARGRTIVSGSFAIYVRVWDIITGECKWILSGHTDEITSVVLDPTKNIACSSSKDKTVRVWDLNTGTERFTSTGHIDVVRPVPLSVISEDGTLRVWDPDAGEMKRVIRAESACFRRSESMALACCHDTVKIWDLTDGSVVRALESDNFFKVFMKATFDDRWCVVTAELLGDPLIDVWDFGTEVTENEDGTREFRDVSDQIGESSNGLSDDTTDDEYEE